MQDDKLTEPIDDPDTQILTDIANQAVVGNTTPEDDGVIIKPQLGPVVIGGKKSHKKLWLTIFLVLLLATNAFTWWYFTQRKG